MTVGPNKGRICGLSGARCRHSDVYCSICGKQFRTQCGRTRHMRYCRNADDMQVLMRKIDDLRAEMRDSIQTIKTSQEVLHRDLLDIKDIPPSCIAFIVDQNYYSRPQDSMNDTDFFKRAYLQGPVDEYPIACRDTDHFRFADSSNRLIDDKLHSVVVSGAQRVCLIHSNELIQRRLDGKASEEDLDTIGGALQEITE